MAIKLNDCINLFQIAEASPYICNGKCIPCIEKVC